MAELSLPEQILRRARFWGLRLATAESCTAGMIAAALTDPPGASDIFDCGFVTYSNAAKTRMLGVRPETLASHGAVSEQVACEMAEGARARAGVALAIAVTGIAGPGGSEHKPEGRVCFALSRDGMPTYAETVDFGAIGRDQVRAATRDHALTLILAALD
jgi:nicotinamide-nucleotide amidase